MELRIAILICALFGFMSACTAPAGSLTQATGNDCFFTAALRDWRPLDDRNLLLFAGGRRPYHVELVRPAFGLNRDFMIGIYDRDGRICPYGGDAVVLDGPIPERILIRSMRRLDDAELDDIYVQFGITAPAIITTEAVDLPPAEED